ncbi:regucalcin-like [Leptopilina heterotoma]|uniref:regucalcin-like n=1 Tax=Leptopilina heterotoma TaxID=63436 RepID=UPI001CA9B6E1|nr:regucalcin-like [Leptopilina heterotoma]
MKILLTCIFSLIFPLIVSYKMSVKIKRVVEGTGLAEGPHWDERSQTLFYVEIYANKICRYNPEDSVVTWAYTAHGPVGSIVPVKDKPNTFVAGCSKDIVLVTWDGENNCTDLPVKRLTTALKHSQGTRFNDGKADPMGRFWTGTYTERGQELYLPNQGELYSLDSNKVLTTRVTSVSISNGLAWSLNNKLLYYIDSPTRKVAEYDYDLLTGSIANKRIAFDLEENNLPGIPDGMTVDSKGNLWVALFEGAQVIQIDPRTKKLLRSIPMPAKRVTSVVFGGPLLDTLYVTTAGYGFSIQNEQTPADDLQGGSIYEVKGTGARGVPANHYKINL